ncbi:hypothetical protein GA0115233_1002110 [Streptomyces sp. DI166]|nr:hypothetical protein GA0115233_1002110 [Streptomyces sp. DI166]
MTVVYAFAGAPVTVVYAWQGTRDSEEITVQ